MLSNQAIRRLKNELRELRSNPAEGMSVGPVEDEDLSLWQGYIMGPLNTNYEDGLFKLQIRFPDTYPMQPPEVKFISRMFHPNVHTNGRVCMSLLLEQVGAERTDRWTPMLGIEKLLLSLVSLLADPDWDNPVNMTAARTWLINREQFKRIVRRTVDESLRLEL